MQTASLSQGCRLGMKQGGLGPMPALGQGRNSLNLRTSSSCQARGLLGLARKPTDQLGKEQSRERCLSLKSPEHRKVAPCPMAQIPQLLWAQDLRGLLAQVLHGTKKKKGAQRRERANPVSHSILEPGLKSSPAFQSSSQPTSAFRA